MHTDTQRGSHKQGIHLDYTANMIPNTTCLLTCYSSGLIGLTFYSTGARIISAVSQSIPFFLCSNWWNNMWFKLKRNILFSTIFSCCVWSSRWLCMTASGLQRSPLQTLQPLLRSPPVREHLHLRGKPTSSSTPCTWVGWSKNTDTSSGSLTGQSLRWDISFKKKGMNLFQFCNLLVSTLLFSCL